MTAPAELHDRLEQGLADLGLNLPSERLAQLLDYQKLLARWNRAYNLTAIREPLAMIERHLLDSLAILPYIQGQSVADLGTGAGLPGLVLAIAAPEREYCLVDANGKKVRFLREVIRRLKLDHVRAEQARVETLEGRFDCITARAFASLNDMLRWGGHLLAPGGRWLAMKGRVPDNELAQLPAPFQWLAVHPLSVPGVAAERHLITLERRPDALAPTAGGGKLSPL